jgi:H+/Cl- antiporter ClcA
MSLLRFALTMVSYGCGAPGGIFAPLLVLGALLGLTVGEVARLVFPSTITHPEAFAVVGMAAYFAAIVRAPLTGIVLIVEMTNTYAQMLPLLVALVPCGTARIYATAAQKVHDVYSSRKWGLFLRDISKVKVSVQPACVPRRPMR